MEEELDFDRICKAFGVSSVLFNKKPMQVVRNRKPVIKKVIKEMMPVKRWLSLSEACSFLDMSVNHFQDLISQNGLTVSVIGKKKFYRVSELEELIESNILIRKIS